MISMPRVSGVLYRIWDVVGAPKVDVTPAGENAEDCPARRETNAAAIIIFESIIVVVFAFGIYGRRPREGG